MTRTTSQSPRYSVAGGFLEALAERDFTRLAATFARGAELHALVPSGQRAWSGPTEISGAFANWFGGAADYELVEAVVGDVGPRLYLRWRLRVRDAQRGAGWFLVEQHVYAQTDDDGLFCGVRLLCSGFCPENDQ